MPKVGELLNSRIVKIIKNKHDREVGAKVKLSSGDMGFLPIRELKEGYVRKVTDVVRVGDEIELRVVNIDRARNKITMSLFRANETVNKEIVFEKRMKNFLKSSGEIQSQIKKNTERKQGTKKHNRF